MSLLSRALLFARLDGNDVVALDEASSLFTEAVDEINWNMILINLIGNEISSSLHSCLASTGSDSQISRDFI